MRSVTINEEQRLYVIPCGDGYTCLGFDVCRERSEAYAKWLESPVGVKSQPGTIEAYEEYLRLIRLIEAQCQAKQTQCPVELTPELIGLENKRVEVVDCYGETRRFYVGKSTGFIPVHLEISKRNSSGGPAVMGSPFKSVRVVGSR